MKRTTSIIIILAMLLAVTAGWLLDQIYVPVLVQNTTVIIPPGAGTKAAANLLAQAGLVQNRMLFEAWVRIHNAQGRIVAGKYLFNGRINLPELLRQLQLGQVHSKRVTIPEGLDIRKTAAKLEQSGLGKASDFIALATDTAFVSKLTGKAYSSLEGMLYPSTYDFFEDSTPEEVLSRMYSEYKKRTDGLDFSHAPLGLDYYQVITLASIVEKEALYPKDKPAIAGVYLNRMNPHMPKPGEPAVMPLQADPTLTYLLEQEGDRRLIYARDKGMNSPYNTYKNTGLPPTPIASPDTVSIKAVLQPQAHQYLYFFARPDGANVYSKSLAEHNRQKKQFGVRRNAG